MKTIIIIPARYASTRFPGKPLKKLSIGNGLQKPLIQLSWEAACRVKNIEEVFVATDDDRIRLESESFGAKVIMTSKECKNGTERCAEAIKNINFDGDIVVNFQGDAPLTPEWFVEDLLEVLKKEPTTQMVTPVLRLDKKTLADFRLERISGRVAGTTVVFNNSGNALYFSKEIIPYFDEKLINQSNDYQIFHHVGVYAYRPEIILKYKKWRESNLEVLEGLEQLRFLENNCSIKCVLVDSGDRNFWELNNPEDVKKIENIISKVTDKEGMKN